MPGSTDGPDDAPGFPAVTPTGGGTGSDRAQRRSAQHRAGALGSAAALAGGAVAAAAFGGLAVTITAGEAGAADLEVTTCADSGPGSLRDAIDAANLAVGPAVITISALCPAAAPVAVGSVMRVTESLAIVGPGAEHFVLDGGGNPILDFDSAFEVEVSGMTFTRADSAAGGAGLRIRGCDRTVVTGVAFVDNDAKYSAGLYVNSCADISVADSVFAGNHTDGAGAGAGAALRNNSGVISVTGCTFVGNASDSRGGGLVVDNLIGTVTVADTTITGNTAPTAAGAFFGSIDGEVRLLFLTVTDNVATSGDSGIVASDFGAGGSLTMIGSIVSGNSGNQVVVDGLAVTEHHNDLVGPVLGFAPDATDLAVDPQLGPLADHGGPTPTQALSATSPVIDRGPTTIPPFPGDGFDQRGVPYVRVSGAGADLGAFELQVASEPLPWVRFTG